MSPSFDVERLLAALPVRPVVATEKLLDGYDPPHWRYPLLGPYNGFTGQQRVRTWELATWLRRRGLFSLGARCDLCGQTERLGGHSENYADIQRTLTLCGGCHLSLHLRFRHPERWLKTLGRLPLVPEWARALSHDPIDLPRWLEATGAPTDALDWIARQFPSDVTVELAKRQQLRTEPSRLAPPASKGAKKRKKNP